MARTTFKIEGLRELEEALSELPKATGKNVLKRALTKAAEPIAETARSLAPVGVTGKLHVGIVASARFKTTVGNAEYSAAMSAGLGADVAGAALRAARHAAGSGNSFAEVAVGPTTKVFYGMFQEFGTAHHGPKPFLRPAWDSHKMDALNSIKDDLKEEIDKAVQRAARKAARALAQR
jgi:HK97 gp10 family phage protein